MKTLVMILAGGKGSRLAPLTCHRAKPAVPFGGRYRIIDLVLSSFVNSGFGHIYVLTQYMASSLIHHLSRNWNYGGAMGHFIESVPAQMRHGSHWYEGTADAVFQNLNLIQDTNPNHVAIFGGDHIYKVAVDQMQRDHIDKEAALTVAAFPVPRSEAHQFGVIQVDDDGRIIGFQEKPDKPEPMPGKPDTCLVSMGNYIFRRDVIEEILLADARDPMSSHDFGKDIIPGMVERGEPVFAYDFGRNRIPGEPDDARPYWRDVGTIDAYFEANMDLRSALPEFNLYNRSWPIRSAQRNYPPARFVRDTRTGSPGEIIDSLVCEGSIVHGARLYRVLSGYDCAFHVDARVEDCVILSGCDVGAGARIRRVLMDKNCSIAPGAVIGEDAEFDSARFPFRTQSGIVTLPKGTHVPRNGPIEIAQDMEFLLANDPATAEALDGREVSWVTSARSRHSHDSVGPRFARFGPDAP